MSKAPIDVKNIRAQCRGFRSHPIAKQLGFTPFGDPDGDGDGNEDEYDDEEELFQDDSPTCEKDIVDSGALHNVKIDPIPSTAADFRSWKNSLFLLLGSLDVSGFDYLMSWVSHAFKVDTAALCAGSSEKVPRLDRWLASQLIKGLKGVLQFKVQGYIERYTRASL